MWKPRVFIFKWIGESRDREWPQRNTMKVSFSKCENNKRLWPKQRRTKVNNSLQELNIVYYSSKLCHNGILIYYVKTKVLWKKKLWYYRKHYVTMDKTTVLYMKLWNFDLRRKKHGRLPKNYETLIYNGKTMVKYKNNWSLWTNM